MSGEHIHLNANSFCFRTLTKEFSQSELRIQEKKDAMYDLDTEIANLRRDEKSKQDRLAKMNQLHDYKVADLKESLQKVSR